MPLPHTSRASCVLPPTSYPLPSPSRYPRPTCTTPCPDGGWPSWPASARRSPRAAPSFATSPAIALARHAARELLVPERARRPRGGRSDFRAGGASVRDAQRRARGEPPAAAPPQRPGLHAQPRLRLRRAGHHQRRRPDRAGPRRRRSSPAGSSRSPTFRSCTRAASAGSWSRRARRGASAARLGALAPRAAARPGARDAGHRRAVDRRDDGPVGREDGEGERHHAARRRTGWRSRATSAPPPPPRMAGSPRRSRPGSAARRWTRSWSADNGIRADTSLDALAKLRPVFDRRYGSVTAGNSSPLTDGAAAVLLMAEDKAKALGYEPLAYLRSYAVAAVDPGWQLLMGPVYAVPQGARARRHRAGATSAWSRSTRRSPRRCSPTCRPGARAAWAERLGLPGPVGEVDWERTNVMGGSIAIGHPFAATGRPAGHDARQRDAPPRRAVRADLHLRAGRDGLRAWCWSATSVGAHHGRRERHRGRHLRSARRAGQQAERRGQGRVRGAAHPPPRRRRRSGPRC